MACKPGQHLLRAKSKTENFGLLALHSCYFFFSAVGCAMTNHWLLLKKQFHSSDVNHCIWAVNFLPKDEWEGLGLNTLLSELLLKYHNPFSHSPELVKNTLPNFGHSFSKMWKCLQYPKQLYLDTEVAFYASIIPHWMQKLVFKTLGFTDKYNQWVKVLGSTVSLNSGKCLKYIKRCIILLTVSL